MRSNESPSGAFKRQNVLAGARWRGLAPTSSAGLACLLFHGNRLFPVQSVVACLKFLPFCKKHCRRIRSLLRAKREPERTAVPAGHESPSGAFKPQTGLQSKCRVFSAARSPLLSRRGRRRVAAPCVCFVPWAALASCRPLPQQLLPVSAAGRGRRRCKLGAARP